MYMHGAINLTPSILCLFGMSLDAMPYTIFKIHIHLYNPS